ncbi:hypothetical protein AN958_02628 [Leucoagaricus sp. SymC.cos]|nr:hypothetical protein AN958_02628 [Leucoagaricus sp. SymC.cos]
MPTELVSYLDRRQNWTEAHLDLPKLTDRRLMQARNAKPGTQGNNDFLEFVGDRIVNLVCALLVGEDSFSPDQQIIVDRLVSNNDTLGRLGYQLHLDTCAELDDSEGRKVVGWSPYDPRPPPKVLADLFEAYAGAVYEEYGWDVTQQWLSTLFKPLIEKANEDFFMNRSRISSRLLSRGTYATHERLSRPAVEANFGRFLEARAKKIATMAEPAMQALPRSTKFVFGPNGDIVTDCDRVEIATHLVKFWICEIFMTLYPEDCQASLNRSHLISNITLLVSNTWSFGHLGFILELGSCFDLEDPDFSLFDKSIGSPGIRKKLAQAVYAVIGWFYSQNTQVAEKWGIGWLVPLVTRAYDLIVQDQSFKYLPHGIGKVDLYANVLEDMGRGPEIPVITTQDEIDARLTTMAPKAA